MLLHSLNSLVVTMCTVLSLIHLNIAVWKEQQQKKKSDPVSDQAKTDVKGSRWQRLFFRSLQCDSLDGKAEEKHSMLQVHKMSPRFHTFVLRCEIVI